MDINFYFKWISFGFFGLSAILHFLFFISESFIFQKENGHKIFKISKDQHAISKIWAFNQGFYNLFLSLLMFMGLRLVILGEQKMAGMIVGFAGLWMIVAGIVLYFSFKPLRQAAFIQAGPPALGFLFLLVHII